MQISKNNIIFSFTFSQKPLSIPRTSKQKTKKFKNVYNFSIRMCIIFT